MSQEIDLNPEPELDEPDFVTLPENTVSQEDTVNTDVKKKQNVTGISKFEENAEVKQTDVVFSMPTRSNDDVEQAIADTPNAMMANNDDTAEWYGALLKGSEVSRNSSGYDQALRQDCRDWGQKVPVIKPTGESINLYAWYDTLRKLDPRASTGEKAVLRSMSGLGLSGTFVTPLWNSGFWVTFKCPSEGTFLEMHALLTASKIRLGREHSGMLLSGNDAFNIKTLTDLALSHIYTSTLALESNDEIRDFIDPADIDSLLWGFACTLYPKGFPYSRACSTDLEKCQHVHRSKLRLDALQFTDKAALSQKQLQHMTIRQPRQMSKASVLEYQKELKANKAVTIDIDTPLGKSLSLDLRSTNLTDYLEASFRWIDGIRQSAEKALEKDAKDDRRNEVISNFANSVALGQYSHFIKSITVDGSVHTDKGTIEDHLKSLTTDPELYAGIVIEIRKFIHTSTISLIAIPVYHCPKCGGLQESVDPDHTYRDVIPIDMVQLFFDLRALYVSRAQRRRVTAVPTKSTLRITTSKSV